MGLLAADGGWNPHFRILTFFNAVTNTDKEQVMTGLVVAGIAIWCLAECMGWK